MMAKWTMTILALTLCIACSLDPIDAPMEISEPDVVADFSFSPNSCGAPCLVTFTDLSQNATQWKWNFGDPSSSQNESTAQNPSHTYNQSGQYTITLEASSGTKQDQISKNINIDIPTYFKTYGSMGSETANAIIETSDNFFVVAGTTNSTAFTNAQMIDYLFLWKFDVLGGTVWQEPAVLKPNSYGHALIENSSGDYVVVGEEFNTTGKSDAMSPIFAIYQPGGSIQLLKDISNPIDNNVEYASLSDILEIGGQYAITGYADLCRPGCPHILLAYLDQNGNILEGSRSNDSFGGNDARGNAISQTPLRVMSFGQRDGDLILRENPFNSIALFDNSIELDGDQKGIDILGTASGDFILVGTTDMGMNGGVDILFMVVDNNLDQVLSPVHIGGALTDQVGAIVPFEEDYVLVGSSNSETTDGTFDILLVKIDLQGNIIWQTTHLRPGEDEYATDVKTTQDGGLIITGYTELSNNTRDIFIMKTTKEGIVL